MVSWWKIFPSTDQQAIWSVLSDGKRRTGIARLAILLYTVWSKEKWQKRKKDKQIRQSSNLFSKERLMFG